jgi:hypothetical protein
VGFDCTLHVVDENALARFVDRFLGRASARSPFDDAFPNAAELVEKTKQILLGDDPQLAGRTLGELAMLYVSAEGPHAYSRGVSLSLWHEASMGAPMPPDGLGSVEELLGPIVDAYPAIRDRVRRFFDQNYCVGPFVRAVDVPGVLAYVEKVLAAMVPGDRRPYQVLARVLRAAAARGMAYWEATDLGVGQAHEEWLEAEVPEGSSLVLAPSAASLSRPTAQSGDLFVMYEGFDTHIVDLSSFPPTSRVIPGFRTIAAGFTPWGTLLMRAATDSTRRPLAFSLFEVGSADGAPRPLAIPLPWDLGFALPYRDRVLLFPNRKVLKEHPDARPLALRDGRLTPLDLPPAKGRQKPAGLELACDAVPFGDGSMLVVWDGAPYRLDGDAVMPLGGGELETRSPYPQNAVAVSDDAIVGMFGQTPVRISRDGARQSILPQIGALAIVRGPGNALILQQPDNVEGDALKIWWPRTREMTSIQPHVFAVDDNPSFVAFASGPGQLVAYYMHDKHAWRALPWDAIAAIPRMPEARFFSEREKLLARSAARSR